MKQIKEVFNRQLSILVNQSKSAAYFQYVARVQCCYKDVIQHIFKQSSALILDHTNNVIVKKEHGVIIGTIFVDESIYAAELNAHREIIALLFSELGNLTLDQVRISCLLYTSDAADDGESVDLGGRRIIKKKKKKCFFFFSFFLSFFFFQAEDGIRDQPRSRGLGDVYKRQS